MKNLKKIIGLSIASFSLCITIASAAGFGGYRLPARKGNVYTPKAAKTSNYIYSYLQVDKLTNTNQMTGWVDNGNGTVISDTYSFLVGTATDMYHNPGYKKGARIRNGMENASSYWFESAYVDGWYNYN